jgi:hypothetical protein
MAVLGKQAGRRLIDRLRVARLHPQDQPDQARGGEQLRGELLVSRLVQGAQLAGGRLGVGHDGDGGGAHDGRFASLRGVGTYGKRRCLAAFQVQTR